MSLSRTLVKDALNATAPSDAILLQGWVRTRRDAKAFSFIELNDGSGLKGIQIIANATLPNYTTEIARAHTGAAIEVRGKLVASQGQGQKWEVIADAVRSSARPTPPIPLQKKGHTLEFLREIAHLRPRSNLFGAVFRVRSRLAYAIHQFFQQRSFVYVHTPIITASDCEGAGELFRVTTLDPSHPPMTEDGSRRLRQDFFGKKAYLTVSGQLEAEAFACALSNVYTFGPTFRAENSNTSRHAAEFWMIEPEMAFCDLGGNMDARRGIREAPHPQAREHCPDDLEFFNKFVDKEPHRAPRALCSSKPFQRCSYTEAIEILRQVRPQ
jgi:asparaginyl-tRNA synthetase